MFIGHFGVGFASKKVVPAISLGVLFLAAQFLDLLWPTLLVLNVEHVAIAPGITRVTPLDFTDYPITHSLLIVCCWAALMGGITFGITKNKKYALVLGLLVISHWFLDLIVHRPDLPLYPGDSLKVGLGLWNYPVLTFLIETIIFFGGIAFYVNVTRPVNNKGRYGLVVLALFLFGINIANMVGPPPPNVQAIAWAGHLQWLFVLMAFWIDKNREVIR